jgi:predicted transcriptional regulator
VAKEAEDRRADFERRDQEINARLTEINARISGLAGEMRDEQRVCFKQLSLEAGEAAVLADRARRAVESRLEKLEKTLSSKKKAP